MADDTKNGDAGSATDDVQRLAKEYVDLWEQQIKALAGDETLAKTMAQTMELMNAGAANVAAMMQAAGTEGAHHGTGTGAGGDAGNGQGERGNDPGTQTAGAASGGSEPDVGSLAVRVAELEKRLDRLESLVEPTGKSPSGKPAKS